MKIAYWDLETSDLDGDFGRILCGSVYTLPSGVMRSFRWDDYSDTIANDEEIAIDIRDHLEDHHMTVGFYSKGFDIPFLNTRLGRYGNELYRNELHEDVYYYFQGWRGVKPRKGSLRVVSQYIGLEEKPDIHADTWVAARTGDEEALDIVVDRCEADVRITTDVHKWVLNQDMCKNITRYP